jgi:hypothetical protein
MPKDWYAATSCGRGGICHSLPEGVEAAAPSRRRFVTGKPFVRSEGHSQSNKAKTFFALAALAGVTLGMASGCSSSCFATTAKLAALERGMSYQDSTRIMGCPGSPVDATSSMDEGVLRFVWYGPDSVFMETELDFQDGRLLYYVTWSPTGF